MKSAGDSLIMFIRGSEQYGLIPSDYHLREIDQLLAMPLSTERNTQLDLLLTDAFLAMRQHLRSGRINSKTLERTDLSALLDKDGIRALENINDRNIRTTLENCQPKDSLYKYLQAALRSALTKHETDSPAIKKRLQLAVNMERLRWMTKPKPDRYIHVNIPAFELKIINADSIVSQTRVIVGKPETPTPELQSVVHSFIIYPYWHVPKSIVKEILPQIQQDTLYLRKHNYDVLDKSGKKIASSTVAWKTYTEENFPYILRQREGSENTMGVIKFVFENHYGIYLHDTNARRLFSQNDRALSHGCIRVQKAVALAHYLAKDDDVYVSPEDLDQYMLLQHRLEVKVAKPIPLYLEYFTCSVKDRKVIFYKDIYNKDKAIVAVLYGSQVSI